jgi:hypothetical protein
VITKPKEKDKVRAARDASGIGTRQLRSEAATRSFYGTRDRCNPPGCRRTAYSLNRAIPAILSCSWTDITSGTMGLSSLKDFEEFYVRFPQHIRRWVSRHADKSASKEDIEDWSQDLCVHLSSLPATSKHREGGKQDVIQTFDPFRHHGANLARFLNYVNHCLANKFRTIHSARIKSPLCRAKRLLSSEIGEEASTDDEAL